MSNESDKIKGRLKQAAGDLTGDDELAMEGELDEAQGDVKDKVGDLVDKGRGVLDDMVDRISPDKD